VPWRDTVVLLQDGVFLMAVAIAPDGMVWSYRSQEESPAWLVTDTPGMLDSTPSDYNAKLAGKPASSDPTWPRADAIRRPKLRCTHLVADTITVGFDAENRPVVFAASGLEMQYAVCVNAEEMRWTKPRYASLEPPAKAEAIEQIYSRRIEGQLHVSAMLRTYRANGSVTYNATHANWDAQGPDFRHTPVFLDSLEQADAETVLYSVSRYAPSGESGHSGHPPRRMH
jgi:hypothetical protein